MSPLAYWSETCFCTPSRVSIPLRAAATLSERIFCFSFSSSVFPGSNFSALLISFKLLDRAVEVLVTSFRAFARPVVLPLISTVMPF